MWEATSQPTEPQLLSLTFVKLGGSPGLVVTGGDSRRQLGRGFVSQYHVLDGYILPLYVVKM